jgi:arylformamidase
MKASPCWVWQQGVLAGWAHDSRPVRCASGIEQRRADREFEGEDAAPRRGALPTGARLLRDVAYGDDRRPAHGCPYSCGCPRCTGAVSRARWRLAPRRQGARPAARQQARHWLPAGFIVVSINYRMLPQADVLTQRDDVVAALAKAQSLAPSWGGDASRFVLMGHSAGAHLVALVASAPRDARIAQSWLGSVLLDSGALDVERLMNERHHDLFDDAFGKDPAFWIATSPIRQLAAPTAPWLACVRAGASRPVIRSARSRGR